MTENELRDEGAIEYVNEILEGLNQLADITEHEESITIKKVISTIEAMMQSDFNLTVNKLDS